MNFRFEPVTPQNYGAISKLAIFDSQQGMVETVEECMGEAKELSTWRPVGIYAEDLLIGFSMYGKFINKDKVHYQVWCDRFFIDKNYQHHGYAKQVFPILIEHIRNEYNCPEIYLSVFENNDVAIHLYEEFGFKFNGQIDVGGEKIMILIF